MRSAFLMFDCQFDLFGDNSNEIENIKRLPMLTLTECSCGHSHAYIYTYMHLYIHTLMRKLFTFKNNMEFALMNNKPNMLRMVKVIFIE